jgi:methylmalonyl-CoA mutase N-terminal domain/subunit
MTAGLGSSKRSNEALKQYREMGQTQGMLVICDRPNAMPIDADHPVGRREAGVLGWHGASLLEFEELMDGIPLTGQSITAGFICDVLWRLAYVVALAEKRGIDLKEVHGSVTEYPFCHTFGQTDNMPLDLNIKLWLDSSEYIIRNKIRMRWVHFSASIFRVRRQQRAGVGRRDRAAQRVTGIAGQRARP